MKNSFFTFTTAFALLFAYLFSRSAGRDKYIDIQCIADKHVDPDKASRVPVTAYINIPAGAASAASWWRFTERGWRWQAIFFH
jgi:hypothetical protein